MADPMNQSTDSPLIAVSRVVDKVVFDKAGERLGVIRDIYIGKVSGEVEFAALTFGGVLGVGEKCHPLPWSYLAYNPALEGFVVDIDRSALEGSPAYGEDWLTGDASWGGEVRTYYAGLGGGANLV